MSSLNPKTTHYEFLGPPGAFAISFGVPFITYALYFGCSEAGGGCPPSLSLDSLKQQVTTALSDPAWWKGLWDTEAALIYLAWYAFCVVAWAILPGDIVEGTTLRDGRKIKYKINAFSTFLLALGVTTGIILRNGPEAFTFIYNKWVG
ncbi:ergosterol biosynthesis ERG4/ERG24 [Pholiota molesta]|nr:ergosterol biosynthesis ERG4/ERG24 [Pholiota molesta]